MTAQVEGRSTSPPSLSLLFAPPSPNPKKRERQLSRNLRPPGSSDGSPVQQQPSPIALQSHLSPSPSLDSVLPRQRVASGSLLTLPLFVQTGAGPSSPVIGSPGRRLARPNTSQQESPSSRRSDSLPWHRESSVSPSRARLFSSPRLPQPDQLPSSSDWSNRARRWSSTLPSNRNSTGLAYRLAEGASPYLRAGLDELRSIFDVDSDPIPISALDEDDDNDDEEIKRTMREGNDDVSVNLDPTVPVRKFTSSPVDIDGEEVKAESSTGERQVPSRQPSLAERSGKGSTSKSKELSEKTTGRVEDGSFDGSFTAASLGIDRGLLAWSLAFIAVGLIALCAYGYAMHSDTFSITLIGFFLTQPAFALMGLCALVMRRRALMDLFSRVMRAHILAQACIVLFAYLDLSSSSIYITSSDPINKGRVNSGFRMVPSMEMRFGPYRRPIQAGDTPGINLLYSSSASASASNSDSISAHAHDTHVGDLQSRLTHLVVFLVQAAFPILAVLIGQYMVAQRLAWLARRSSVSRQNSLNKQHEKSSPPLPPSSTLARKVSPRRLYDRKTLPSGMMLSGERLSSRLARAQLDVNTVDSIPSSQSVQTVQTKSHSPGHSRSLSQPMYLLENTEKGSINSATIESSQSTTSIPSSTLPPDSPLRGE